MTHIVAGALAALSGTTSTSTPGERLLHWYKFSEVLYIVTLHRKYTRALTFENFCLSIELAILDQRYPPHILKSPVYSDFR